MVGRIMEVLVDTRHLGDISCDFLGLWHFSDEKPLKELTGLIDWKLDAKISQLIISGRITGDWGEKVLLGALPPLSGVKIIIVGIGLMSECSPQRIKNAASLMVGTAMKLKEKNICMALPGMGLIDLDGADIAEYFLDGLVHVIGKGDFRPRILCSKEVVDEVLLGMQKTKVKLKGHFQIDITQVER
ncbi:MAG: hypothetical protein J7L53_12855 [Deltaproteobacteria bacterium]|nr:hypothetical protein [Deltaproteobacteria bacterium]